ncbi:MAG TPA: carboxylesterase family protein, partial [Steroidobacteraceae bacterium]|nr:carboxylesterase family protein [Steroidobacteraceae bacterium]
MNSLSRRFFLSASLGLAAGSAVSCSNTDAQPDRAQPRSSGSGLPPARIVQTRLGQVRGQDRGRTLAFLGLRYAKPPTGVLRFTPPQPCESWTGVYEATKLPPFAVQPPEPPLVPIVINGRPQLQGRQSEDCLFLNIYTPAADQRKRPVLVWIHGGGYTVGSANEYDGGILAAQGDVVVVCINYRLGVFGFTDFSGLDKGLAGSASNGFRDQIEALRWVRNNIADYGGDPAHVTIFGESAGGGSVLALLAAPSAEGLFHRAIAHSPGGSRTPPPDDIPKLTRAVGLSGAGLLERLRALSAEELVA